MEIDKTSLLVTIDTDISMAELENLLAKEGYTLNYFTPPQNKALLVEVLNERLPNLYAAAFGGIEDLCVQLSLAQTDGRVFTNVLTPRSATGPSLKKMAIGAQEKLGIPFQATLKIFYRPPFRKLSCAIFPDRRRMEAFLRSVYKLRLKLPLLSLLATGVRNRFFEKMKAGEEILGFASWGEQTVVEAQFQMLQQQASLKKGQWVEVGLGDVWDKLFSNLHEGAAIALGERLSQAKAPLSPSHRALAQVVEGIS
jgi:FAD/FMN-containing dehydrogenase